MFLKENDIDKKQPNDLIVLSNKENLKPVTRRNIIWKHFDTFRKEKNLPKNI